MLACARIGAVHSVVFGGFAAKELAVRIDDAAPKVIVSASCGIEVKRVIEYKPLLDRAIELATHKPERCVILARPQAEARLGERDVDWATAVAEAGPADCVPVLATDPLYILYTSGTTGKPKGVVRDNGGHAVALRWSMANIYDVGPGEVMFTASDVGWVVGHSYIVYAPLLTGATTVLLRGQAGGHAGRRAVLAGRRRTRGEGAVHRAHRVPGDQEGGPEGRAARRLRPVGLPVPVPGRRAARPGDAALGAGPAQGAGPSTTGGRPRRAGRSRPTRWGSSRWTSSRGRRRCRCRVGTSRVLAPSGRPAEVDTDGALVVKLPLPPGALPTLWQDDERYVASYLTAFDGYYLTGDGGHVDADGYLFVMGRTDDVINVAGHRLSTGVDGGGAGRAPGRRRVRRDRGGRPDEGPGAARLRGTQGRRSRPTRRRCAASWSRMVRDQVGAVASFKDVAIVPALPKTRSGKILRKTMRGIADGHRDEPIPSTIDDASVLDALRPILQRG